MLKWIAAVGVAVITMVIAGAVGLYWNWAIHSQDLATIVSFGCGIFIGVIGTNFALLVYEALEDREEMRSQGWRKL